LLVDFAQGFASTRDTQAIYCANTKHVVLEQLRGGARLPQIANFRRLTNGL
jgi:hypothetical protein